MSKDPYNQKQIIEIKIWITPYRRLAAIHDGDYHMIRSFGHEEMPFGHCSNPFMVLLSESRLAQFDREATAAGHHVRIQDEPKPEFEDPTWRSAHGVDFY